MDLYFYLLSQIEMDHSKFDNLEKGLKGEIIVNKLFDGFELFLLFRRIKSNIPSVTHGPLIELDVLTKEMIDLEIPLDIEWKEIERVG